LTPRLVNEMKYERAPATGDPLTILYRARELCGVEGRMQKPGVAPPVGNDRERAIAPRGGGGDTGEAPKR
jgi:hypothetical protein